MSISGLSNLFQTQQTEEVAGVQRIRQEREGEAKSSPSSFYKTDSVTISAEARRMSEAMQENNARQNNNQNDDQSGTKNGFPAESAGISISENGVLSGATIRTLPDSILASSDKNLANIIEKGTKVLFEFGDDGSISIKQGLSTEDYIRAQATLREWEMHEPGLGF